MTMSFAMSPDFWMLQKNKNRHARYGFAVHAGFYFFAFIGELGMSFYRFTSIV